MKTRNAAASEADYVAALVSVSGATALPKAPASTIANQIRYDIDSPRGQSHWLLIEGESTFAAHVAVIPAPPIYLESIVGVVLGLWGTPTFSANAMAAVEQNLRARNVAKLIAACPASDTAQVEYLTANGYRATTLFMAKPRLAQADLAPHVRTATEADIPHLVAFNREARARLHEANPDFWTSHPDAEARFGLWMKISLTLRDRTIFVHEHSATPSGFIIAQPSSPIQIPATCDAASIGVIDDFHDEAFGRSLTEPNDATSASALLAAAETALPAQGNTAAVAICPAAWTVKSSFLERAGYRTHHIWFVKNA